MMLNVVGYDLCDEPHRGSHPATHGRGGQESKGSAVVRVLMVSRGVLPIGRHCGGAELVAFELSRNLAMQNHEVTLIADVGAPMLQNAPQGFSAQWPKVSQLCSNLVRLIPVVFVRWLCQHLIGNIRAARCAVETLKNDETQFDIIHVHGALAAIIISRTILRSGISIPVVYTEHDSTPWTCAPRRVTERVIRRLIYTTINLRACRYSDITVTNYPSLAKELTKITGLPPCKFLVMPNGADAEFFRSGESAGGETKESTEKRYCLFVGSLIHRKAPDLLLRALAQAKTDLGLVVVGDGPMADTLRTMAVRLRISNRVLFLGPQPRAAVRRCYQRAAFLVLPSVSEAVPLVVIEALSSGTPVVATQLEGIASVVSHGENGLLVPPGDVEALASALETVANDRSLYERLAYNASASVRSQFSWAVIAREFSRVYAEETHRKYASMVLGNDGLSRNPQPVPDVSSLTNASIPESIEEGTRA